MAISPADASTSKQADDTDAQLFKGVCFFLNDSLRPDVRDALHNLLMRSGAEPCPPSEQRGGQNGSEQQSDPADRRLPRFDPQRLTHLITDSLDFLEYDLVQRVNGRDPNSDHKGKGKARDTPSETSIEAAEDRIHVVTAAWATRSFDLQTLQPPRFYSADKTLFFSGTVVCTSELPPADTREIQQAVHAFGGQTRRELTREVTHLICAGESGRKYKSAILHGTELGMQVVLPHWFEESFKHSTLVPTDIYRFPSPPFATSLRDETSSKPFSDRLFDYWRTRLVSGVGTSSSSSNTLPTVVPNTATYMILGPAGRGGAMPDGGGSRPADTQQYLRTTIDFASSKRKPQAEYPPAVAEAAAAESPHFFAGKRIYLASDLAISLGFEEGLRAQVARAGGACWSFQYGDDDFPRDFDAAEGHTAKARERRSGTGDSADAWETRRRAEKRLLESDIVIIQAREGWEYWTAYERSLSIGNLPYFYDCIASQTLLSPLGRLGHYPVPSLSGLPDWPQRDHDGAPIMTVSNYAGEARDYVRAMIELLGGRFEGTMSKSTDYVVSASENGSKVSHAREWHIPLVTHLWLEALILEWRYIPPSADPSYLLSPSTSSGTHYATILGDTPYTREVIRRWASREKVRAERNEAMRPIEELERVEALQRVTAGAVLVGDTTMLQAEDAAEPAVAPQRPSPVPVRAEPRPVDQPEEAPKKPPRAASKSAEPPKKPKSRTKTPVAVEMQEVRADVEDDRQGEAPAAKPAAPDLQVDTAALSTPNQRTGSKASKTEGEKRQRARSDSSLSSASSSSEDLPPSANKMSKAFALISGENLLQGSSRRGAAAKAQAALIDQIKDRNAYEKEQKSSGRKKGGISRRSRSPSKKVTQDEDGVKDQEMSDADAGEEDEPAALAAKSQKAPAASKAKARRATESDEDEAAAPARKKAKPAKPVSATSAANKNVKGLQASAAGTTQDGGAVSSFDRPPNAKPPPITKAKKPKIISTGLGYDKDHAEIKKMKSLGAAWTDSSKDATHLVVKTISRTEKFLCSLPYSPKIVTQGWIAACIDAGRLVDETPYLLKDVKKEKEIGDTLEAILARARQHKLFDGYNVYVTRRVQPDTTVMQRIISACGGTVHTKDVSKFVKKIVNDPRALVVSCEADKREWQALAAAPHHQKVYSVEAVLQAALHQELTRGFTDGHRIDGRWAE